MVSAYILIETSPGMAGRVVEGLHKFEWVKKANAVTGPYDVICIVESENLSQIGRNIVTSIQELEGVLRTLTCIDVDH